MGLAVPSVAGASRGLPSVKTDLPPADDDIVTSVALTTSVASEPVSPELALVDPALAEKLRSDLPEAVFETAVPVEPAVAAEPEREVEPAPPARAAEPEVVEAAPGPAPDLAPAAAVVPVPSPATSNVHVLRPAPVVEAPLAEPVGAPSTGVDPDPRPVLEARVVDAIPAPAPLSSAQLAPAPAASVTLAQPSAGPKWRNATAMRRTLAAFVAGAIVASVVVVGVIAELGESDGAPTTVGAAADGGSPSLAPPSVAAPPPPAGAPVQSGGTAKKTATKPKAVKKAKPAAKPSGANAKAKASTAKRSAPKASSPKASRPKARAAATPSRRFAWAPVDGAVGYRVELFRGNEQVLRATTKQPVFELAGSWRHQGRAERLTPGSYRWYVWPVLPSGPAAQAVVQARLDVP